jgi:peptidoglycan hydrolase-like protein with peptidoglycan-binding domain
MTNRMLALATSLMISAPLLAVSGFAQTAPAPAPVKPVSPAPAVPAAAAPSAAAPTASAASGAAAPARHAASSASRTERVMKLQTALNANGATLTADGKMGPKTKSALMDFQKSKGLKATGKVDKDTIAALKLAG